MSTAKESNVIQTQYLTFLLAGEEYAIGILRIKEIIEFDTLTKVPSTPACIRGVINLRGSVVPVIDLAIKFGLPESQITKWTCIIIVEVEAEGERMVMGVMADTVNQVIDLMPGDIEPPPPFGINVRIEYLIGMGKIGKKFAMILDIDRVLSTGEILAVNSVQNEDLQIAEPAATEMDNGESSAL